MPITENLATDTGVVGDLITADPTLTGSAKPNVLLTLTEGGQVLGTATADGSGIWSFRPVGLADGAHTIVVGNDLNVAIQGTGFFQIQLPDGEIAYTRDGGFTLSATGQLVTANGNVVLPGITIPNSALAVTIDDTGTVQVLLAGQSAPIQVGNLQIATFANEAGLVPLGGGLFQASANSGAPITGSPGSPGFGTISQAETASLSFTLDTSAPQPANHLANDTGVSQTDAVTSDATLTGLAAPNETLVFTEGTAILGTTTADASGIWTFVPPNLTDGTHDIAADDSQDFNLGVQGNGYFQIQLPDGEIAYTRDGSFSLSATGQLVTADGNVVQPAITIPSGALAVTIDDTGTVRALLDGQPTPVQLGSIQLAIFANQAGLTPLGGNLFQASPASGAPEVGSPGSSGIGSVTQLGMSDVNFTLVTPITENLATDTGVVGDLITADPTLTGSAKPNVLLTLTEGGQVLGTATADGSGIWSFRPVGLADGAHTIVVGNDLNVAIQGTGFFQIQLPDGEIAYTRDGGFTLSATGQLVTANGNVVLPGITIPNSALAVTIDDTGTVQVLLAGQSAPIQVGNLQIATFANEAGLVPLGGGLFQASANSGAPITGSPGSPGFGTISQAETASLSFTLDTSAPQPANHLANDTGVSQTDAVTSDATLTGLAAPNETLVFTEGTAILGTTTADASGIWTFVPPNLTDGTHDIAADDSQDFNLGVQGNGYFQIQLPDGEIAYTRDGSFSLSATGQLVTADGNVVQPAITIPSGALAVTIDDTGTVRALLDGQPTPVQLGSIQLAIFANQAGLTPLGGNLFQASPASGTPEVGSPGSSGFGSVTQLGMSDANFTLDTQAPAVPTIQSLAPGSDSGIDGDGITNVAQPTVVGTADAGSTVVLSDGAVQVGSAIADPGSGAWSIIIQGTLSDGEHLLTATSSDPAGNVSPASAPLDVTIDTIAPPVTEALALDTGASSSDGITSDATLVGSGDPNAVVTLTVDGSPFATTGADGTGAWTFTPSLPDGPHTIVASETDTAGNLASASLDVTLLTQGPAIPTIQGLAPGSDSGIDGDGITNVAQPTVVGTADAGSTVVLSDGAVQVGSAIADPGSGAWSIIIQGTLSDGEHLLTATSSDPAGNVSPASAPLDVTIDTIAPPVTEALALDTGASSSDGITSDATLVGSGDPNAVVTLTVDGSPFATTGADGTGAWTFTPSLPDGPHTIVASETDTAGNLASASLDVTLLTQGPAIPTIQGLAPGSDSGIDGDGITNVAQPTVVGTADAGSTVVLSDGAVQVGSAIADPGSGAWSIIIQGTLSDGEHLLTATSSDPAGNVSPASAPLDVTIDTIAPPVTEALALDTGASSSDGITSDATLVGSGDPNAVVTLTEGGSLLATTVADGTGAWTFTPSLPDGPHTIVASETDTAGNFASASLDFTLVAQTFWKDPLAGGLWETPGNWTNNVPTAGTDAFLDLSAAATITATAADDAARSLEISNLTSGAITDLLVSGTLAIGKSVTVNRGGELDVAAGGLFNQTNSAGIAIQSGAALSVQGILQASGGLSVVGSSSGLVSVSIGSGGTLDVGRTSGDSSLSFATVSLDGGTLLQGQGKLFIDAATTITSTANSVIGESSVSTSGVAINNSGLIISLGGTLIIDPPSPGASQGINSSGGTVSANGGAIDVDTSVTDTSTGAFNIMNGGQLEFDTNVNATGESIDFLAGLAGTRDGTLVINNAVHGIGTIGPGFTGPLTDDFSPSSTNSEAIDFRNLAFNPSDTIAIDNIGGTNVLQIMDGSVRVAYDGLGIGSVTDPSSLSIVADGFGGTAIACFLRGTHVLSPDGEVAVEDLSIGDLLVTVSGAVKPIRWIGRRNYSGRFAVGNRTILPILIRAGALADGVPRRDLLVSPKHAMFLNGMLIPAEHLTNGISIIQLAALDEIAYFHIELNDHNVIHAEGALAETFVDDENRGIFQNAHEYHRLYPAALPTTACYCADRVEDGYELEAVRGQIDQRAGLRKRDGRQTSATLRGSLDLVGSDLIYGWAQNSEHPEAPVCVDIFDNEVLITRTLANHYRLDLKEAGLGSGHHGFEVKLTGGLCPLLRHVIRVSRTSDGSSVGSPRVVEPENGDASGRIAA